MNPSIPPGDTDIRAPDPIQRALRLIEQGQQQAAIEVLTTALAANPRGPAAAQAHFLLGNAHQALGNLGTALESYRLALALNPRHVFAHNNMGGVLQLQGRLDAAIGCYQKALALKPDYPESLNNLAGALQLQGRLDESIACYHKALALRPWYPDANSSLLMALAGHPGTPPATYLAQAQRYGAKMRARAKPFTFWPAASQSGKPAQLRVGLVSGELRMNPVGHFIESTLAALDPARIQLLSFNTDEVEDELTARIKPLFAEWHSFAGLTDEAAARLIHAAAPHVLIDLAGHTVHNRLPVFAWKPAPVQVSWLGYFASTGVPGMDYILADAASVPEENRRHFSETVWHLPETRLCFTAPTAASASPPAPLPALRNGFVSFGSFQRLTKLNDGVLAAWGRILQALPTARLRLQLIELLRPEVRTQLVKRLSRFGIEQSRVTLLPQVTREAYLAAHAEIDLILDTFPFPGGTTTCEALWMGVPTLTLHGNTLLSRQGASLLGAAGLSDWVAGSVEDYIAQAIARASDVAALTALRTQLRARVRTSPLFDAPRFARHLETALHGMWAAYLSAGKPPAPPKQADAATLVRQSAALFHKGRVNEAMELVKRGLALYPDNTDLLNHRGVLGARLGDATGAEAAYRRALALKPEAAENHYNLGNLLGAQSRPQEAEAAYRQAITVKPGYADAHANLGNLLQAQGRTQEAEAAYRKAIALRPDYADTYSNLGNLLQAQRRPQEAETAYRKAIALNPGYAQAHTNLGVLLKAQQRPQEAEAAHRRAIALKPDYAEAHSNLGVLLMDQKRPQEAEAAFLQAIAVNPAHTDAYSNLGNLLQLQQRPLEAEAAYRKAVAIKPDHADARWNLSLLLLKRGRFAEGWPEFEARYAANRTDRRMSPPPLPPGAPDAKAPRQWQGEPLDDKSLLIWPEQGLGDEIQFARYAPLLKARGVKHLTLACKPPLQPLIANQGLADSVISSTDWRPDMASAFDFWCYPLSLPLHFGTTLETIPATIPYLKASPDRVAHWATCLPKATLRVGLVWKGSSTHKNDANRSLASLLPLAPLWSIPEIAFVSLQKGAEEDEANSPPDGQPLTHLGGEVADFADSAAILSQLDLLICVDTAVAHLAGAMGIPCWVLLPEYGTDWRWLEGRDDSPWYPETMRLFRQASDGDWDGVVARVVEALRVHIAQAPRN